MSAVVDQLIGSALASATANDNPVAVAFVREGPYAPGCGGFCPLLRGAESRSSADRRPTLIVTADEDAVGPPSIAQELADKIGGAKTLILNRCGHWSRSKSRRSAANSCRNSCAEFLFEQ